VTNDHLPSTVVTVCKRDCQSCHLENNRQLFRHCQDNITTDNEERTNWLWSCRNRRCTGLPVASVDPPSPPASAAQTGFSKSHTETCLSPARSNETTHNSGHTELTKLNTWS